MIKNSKFLVNTNGNDIVDITVRVKETIDKEKINNGLISIHSPFSSAAIGIMEYNPDMVKDFFSFILAAAPLFKNGKDSSYIKSLIIGNSVNVPYINGDFELDRFQRILLFDFDFRKRVRSVIIQIIY